MQARLGPSGRSLEEPALVYSPFSLRPTAGSWRNDFEEVRSNLTVSNITEDKVFNSLNFQVQDNSSKLWLFKEIFCMMALLKNHRSLFATDKCSTLSKPFPQMKINKKLDFDSFSKEDIPRSSSPDPVDLHKKLIFDDSEEDFDLSDGTSSPMKFEENNVNVVATKIECC